MSGYPLQKLREMLHIIDLRRGKGGRWAEARDARARRASRHMQSRRRAAARRPGWRPSWHFTRCHKNALPMA